MLEIQKYTKIIAANWKMNGSINFISEYLNGLDNLAFENIQNKSKCIIICPPFTYSYLIANQLKNLGLDVTLITGPTHQQIASEVNIIRVNTAKEMLAACKETLPVDVAVCAAAVSDWTVN